MGRGREERDGEGEERGGEGEGEEGWGGEGGGGGGWGGRSCLTEESELAEVDSVPVVKVEGSRLVICHTRHVRVAKASLNYG